MINLRPRQSWKGGTPLYCCLQAVWRRIGPSMVVAALLVSFKPAAHAQASLPESQVKALFLFNFAKYVEWPAEAFAGPTSPITIGIIGTSPCTESLRQAVEGKKISDRPIIIRQVDKTSDLVGCHILFISNTEKRHLSDLLRDSPNPSVLTVGETERFAEQGGVIGFVKKDGKVRLEINLTSARQAKLEISSKLLSVADNVLGR